MKARFTLLLCFAVALLLAGCALGPSGEPARGVVTPLRVDQAAARNAISAYRRAHGLGDVVLDPALQAVAQRQAEAMARANELSHTVAGTLPQRLAESTAARSAAVENVSAGYTTFASAFEGWRRSPAHDANLLFAPRAADGDRGGFGARDAVQDLLVAGHDQRA